MSTKNGANEKITIVGVEVENYRRLTVAVIKHVPSKGLVRVTGANGSGKTSLLKSVAGALGGQGEVHKGSLHEGAENGRVTLHLSNGYTVERRITEANPKGTLTVVGPDEGTHKQGKLNSWLGDRSFDPLAFLSLEPDRQREVLFSIGTDPDLDKKLDEVRTEHTKVYGERTPVISRSRHLAAIDKPEGERPEPVDTSAEMERLGELQARERELGDANRKAHDTQHDVSVAKRAADQCLAERNRLQDLLSDAEAVYVKAQAAIETARAVRTGAQRFAEKLPDPTEAMGEVQARLSAASEIQAAIEPWTRWDKSRGELGLLKERESKLTDELGALKTREADLLANAGIPVEGLSFGEEGEPLLNGRAIALASGREQMDLAVDVAFAADPDLGICLLDEGNDLDLEALDQLNDRALAKGFQVWICRIGLESKGEIVVEDGVAVDAESLQEQPA
ncbi:MAG: AAA family ATPase [Gemmatimonadota bacterium]